MPALEAPAHERVAAFARHEVDGETPGDRARRGHPGVVDHPVRVLDDHRDDEQIGDLGEGQKRRIKKGDNEQAGSADGGRKCLDPRERCFHRDELVPAAQSSSPCADMTEPSEESIAWPVALAAIAARLGHRRRARLLPRGADPQPLRREGASGRRSPRDRQPDAGLAADRRRVAPPAARAESAAGPDRRPLPHRRLGRRDFHRQPGGRGLRCDAPDSGEHRVSRRCGLHGAVAGDESQHPVLCSPHR